MRCKQCGTEKLKQDFRLYYNQSGKRYTICLDCERINSRRKYLLKKSGRTVSEQAELDDIHKLYDLQRAAGLKPPSSRTGHSTLSDQMQQFSTTPADLQEWLDKDLTGTVPEENDAQYNLLKKKYMPVIGLNMETIMPIYDTRFKTQLDDLAEKLENYEDTYWR